MTSALGTDDVSSYFVKLYDHRIVSVSHWLPLMGLTKLGGTLGTVGTDRMWLHAATSFKMWAQFIFDPC
jgi:hypothetical protein